jgi:AraC-like DNA-binding protein
LTAGVRVLVRPEDQLIACRVSGGDPWVRESGRELDPDHPWIASQTTTQIGWDGRAEVHAFVFDLELAQQIARQITGDDRLTLRALDAAPVNSTAGTLWNGVYRHLYSSLGTLETAGESAEVLESELARHALCSTLALFPTTFAQAMERPGQTRAAPTTARRAARFMDENAQAPITIDDVAQAVHISTRGLQYAFKREYDLSPREYLRRARIAGAHSDLVRRTGSVGEVARRWGFLHVSRFARYYRAEYGVHPSETLRRS